MKRPALKRLLADIEVGKVDCVVVYKVDRLSRSLLDFSRIMETFDKHGVSFVSVTQQFNTSSSMGRLMLNVLLSFAQFEREIISERTRDKMAAARRKGKYVGGAPILGYDIDRDVSRLVVNKQEAIRVRQIFELYLASHKVRGIAEMIEAAGAKIWYLPPYSPDLNPIEQMWSKVKSLLRSFAKRTKWSLISGIGQALSRVTPAECINYFANCGYSAKPFSDTL